MDELMPSFKYINSTHGTNHL